MRKLIDGTPESKWLVFRTRAGREAARRYFVRRGWYVNVFEDVAGPSLHAARVWFTSPPCDPATAYPSLGGQRFRAHAAGCKHRVVGV